MKANAVRAGALVHDAGTADEEREMLRALLGSAPLGVAIVDVDLRYRLVNDALAEMNGISAEGHIGRRVAEVVPDLAPSAAALMKRMRDTGAPVLNHEIVGETPRAPGRARVWLESWYPLHRDDASVWAAGIVVEEITVRRDLEGQLREANDGKNRFISVVSHELRNALNPAVVAARAAADPGIDAGARERMLAIVQGNLRAAARLLDDLREVSRAAHGKIECTMADIDLAAVVRDTLTRQMPVAGQRGVTLHLECEVDRLPLRGDAERLAQVFSNLVLNALRHTDRGRGVRVRVDATQGEATVAVADEGSGIPADALAHVFEPFFSTERDSPRDGLGIGLAVAQAIVAAHGGRIEAASEGAGRGATFTVRLPALAR